MEGVSFRRLATVSPEPVDLMVVWLPTNENPALAAFVEAYRFASDPGKTVAGVQP